MKNWNVQFGKEIYLKKITLYWIQDSQKYDKFPHKEKKRTYFNEAIKKQKCPSYILKSLKMIQNDSEQV